MCAASNKLAALDAELAGGILSQRDHSALQLLVERWYGAAARQLTALEFPWPEVQELLEMRMRAIARETKFTGVLCRVPRRTA